MSESHLKDKKTLISLSIFYLRLQNNAYASLELHPKIINFVFKINSTRSLPGVILHVESSFIDMGIANLECAVHPPGISNDVIPLDATLMTISPSERNVADKALHRNFFPVPTYPYTKNS